eukprot:1110720-Amphidinium_carterae.2
MVKTRIIASCSPTRVVCHLTRSLPSSFHGNKPLSRPRGVCGSQRSVHSYCITLVAEQLHCNNNPALPIAFVVAFTSCLGLVCHPAATGSK